MKTRQQFQGFPRHNNNPITESDNNQTIQGGPFSFKRGVTINSADNPQLKIRSPLDGTSCTFYYDGTSHGINVTPPAGGFQVVGLLGVSAGITQIAQNMNLQINSANGASASFGAPYLVGASCIVSVGLVTNNSVALSAGFNAVGCTIGSQSYIEAASGTHAIIAGGAVKAPVITNGVATTTDATTLYIEGAPTGTFTPTNPQTAIWSDSGINRFDGALQLGVNVSSAGTLTLDTTANVWVFSGTTATWTLPAISAGTGVTFRIKNRGSGSITLNSNAGGNDIYNTSAVSTLTITAGSAFTFINDGTFWLVC